MPIKSKGKPRVDKQKHRTILSDLRLEKGYTQEACVEKLNEILKRDGSKPGASIVLKTYQQYEQEKTSPSAECLIALSKLYGVSVDYILGITDFASVNGEAISKETGLSDAAISTLADIKKVGHIYAGHSELDTLNFLLSDKWECSALLASIQDLFHAQYSIPVYHVETGKRTDEKGNETPLVETVLPSGKIDVDKVFDSNGDVVHETRYVHLAKDENDLRDNVSIAINQDFLESVALINIEKRLRAFRDKYTRNHSAEKSAQ